MGSRYKKSIVSENVRRSLHGWINKAKTPQEGPYISLVTTASTMSLDSMVEDNSRDDASSSLVGGFRSIKDSTSSDERSSTEPCQQPNEISPSDEMHYISGSKSDVHAEICDCEGQIDESNDDDVER